MWRTSGEQWDFDVVYRRQWGPLVRFAYVTTESLAHAEEVVQDVFVQLYRHRDTVERPEAWLRHAVANRVTSWVRRRQVERRHRQQLGAATHVPAVTLEFVAMLAPLSPRQRAALFLRYHEDLSEQEIATVLGCRPGTVKSLINRALARLRERLNHNA
ncbi:sigma-70 family RNA polymerase sigma factor [Micromonospora sp. R77]|uniref:RNA polymerase sigma factor n=1 Tax=Micromonospora sp. R77 TaxID=2925836 RepID=UPI001F5FF903|nr:sigma-70 family RNA polymerase sigma factor [Micromonospora sp. R77]MCI4063481.1 sigma-70 family RNA polymerase sigma factor [Micromonospora sp. R77]